MIKTTARMADLREMLCARRREMQNDVQGRIRQALSGRSPEGRDALEHADADVQGDIELSLLQKRAEALAHIEAALARLDAGKYGLCFECEDEISEQRLRALPFAVRCQACEGKREEGQARHLTLRRSISIFPDAISS